jgi:acetyl-CoA carboxylase biotin carboxyl carrier protein
MASSREHQKLVDELTRLVKEFKLEEAEVEVPGFRVAMRKSVAPITQVVSASVGTVQTEQQPQEFAPTPSAPAAPAGTPISSPMTGIFYDASSPSSPPYVKEGDSVTAGQVVGLIEAMKVYNELHATTSGTVLKVLAPSGSVVHPGDPIMYIG